jgi:hypothetical protein
MDPTSPASSASFQSQDTGNEHPVSTLDVELGRRLFYTTLVGYRTLQQMGSHDAALHVPPETPTERYPPLPLEVDDEYMFPNHVEPQPAHKVSRLVGFNANVRVYSSYNPISAWETAFGAGQIFDWDRQRFVIYECLQKSKLALANVPKELSLFMTEGGPLDQEEDVKMVLDNEDLSSSERRHVQYEIQKANIYASQLATRSYLVEKYWSLHEAWKMYQPQPNEPSPMASTAENGSDPTDHISNTMIEERRLVIRDLFVLLQSVNEINMEPNGSSVVSFGLVIQVWSLILTKMLDIQNPPNRIDLIRFIQIYFHILTHTDHGGAPTPHQSRSREVFIRIYRHSGSSGRLRFTHEVTC